MAKKTWAMREGLAADSLGDGGAIGFVFGDQLDLSYPEALGLERERDVVLMVEVREESEHVASHVQRTVLFLSAMRHHAIELRDAGWRVRYVTLDDPKNAGGFGGELERAVAELGAERVACVRPGEHRVRGLIEEACEAKGVELSVEEDPHFTCTIDDFADWAEGRKRLTMEYFYRERRKALDVLMDGSKPEGGEWNYDKENRETFKKSPTTPVTPSFEPNAITTDVIEMVGDCLPDLPGTIKGFGWPVTRKDAAQALGTFIAQRLPDFGTFQDAMWKGERTLNHAVLSPLFNLKLLDPMDAVRKAERAYADGSAPLNSVEGFVRQLIGWREFIRGVYFTEGKDYERRNGLRQYGDLPEFYWSGETDMACLSDCIGGVVDHAYGHHIERLMVTGNFAMIAGVHPQAVTDWYLGMYADAVAWATEPNVRGMAMHADGGVVGTKPYAASGKYVQRMSNYCKSCAYDVKKRTGQDACPFNVFYWDFLSRNRERFKGNQRMNMIMKNVERMDEDELQEITVSARRLRDKMGIGGISA